MTTRLTDGSHCWHWRQTMITLTLADDDKDSAIDELTTRPYYENILVQIIVSCVGLIISHLLTISSCRAAIRSVIQYFLYSVICSVVWYFLISNGKQPPSSFTSKSTKLFKHEATSCTTSRWTTAPPNGLEYRQPHNSAAKYIKCWLDCIVPGIGDFQIHSSLLPHIGGRRRRKGGRYPKETMGNVKPSMH